MLWLKNIFQNIWKHSKVYVSQQWWYFELYIIILFYAFNSYMSHFYKNNDRKWCGCWNLRCLQVISTSCMTWHMCHITWPQMHHESLHRQMSIHEEKCCTFFSYFLSDTPFYKASLFFGHFWDISGWTSSIQPILF